MAFQGFRVEHQENRSIIYPYGERFKTECIYLEDSGDIVVHKHSGNKMGRLNKPRHQLTLTDLQELAVVHLGSGIYIRPKEEDTGFAAGEKK